MLLRVVNAFEESLIDGCTNGPDFMLVNSRVIKRGPGVFGQLDRLVRTAIGMRIVLRGALGLLGGALGLLGQNGTTIGL